jgi:hypothetical protein
MIAVAHDQERLVGELLLQLGDEVLVVLGAQRLPAQILVDQGLVAGRAP